MARLLLLRTHLSSSGNNGAFLVLAYEGDKPGGALFTWAAILARFPEERSRVIYSRLRMQVQSIRSQSATDRVMASEAPLELRSYQAEAIAATEGALAQGITRQVWSMATGVGKTVAFATLLRRRGERALVVAHRDELIRQAVKQIERAWPGANIGVVRGQQDEWDRMVVVASVQSLRPTRLARWAAERFATVIVDEAHHAIAPSYQRLLAHLRPELLLGVTATPFRGDRASLEGVFQKIVFTYGLRTAIEANHLVDIRAFTVTTFTNLDRVHTVAGDFAAGELEAAVNTLDRNREVVRAYQTYADPRPTIVFAAGIDHAGALTDAFVEAGIPAAMLTGETPMTERRALLESFKTGQTTVVVNVGVLTEGFDEPAVSAIILARPTKSLPLFTQMAGRGMRPSPETGKRDCMLLDLVDATSRHRLVSVADLVGLRRQPRPGERLVASALAEETRARNQAVAFARSLSLSMDLEPVQELLADFTAVGDRPRVDWREIYDEILELEDEGAGGEPTDAQIKALQGFGWPEEEARQLQRRKASRAIDRHKRAVDAWSRQRARLFALILGVEEDDAIAALTERGVWQFQEATPAQLRYLAALRIALPPGGLSKGEASALIDRGKTRRDMASQTH